MTKQISLIGVLVILSALLTACGTASIPAYEQDETSVAVARTETREALIAQGEIVPTNTPTVIPSPTVDFEATVAAEQEALDAQATLDAETAQAEADAQATVDAEAAVQAEADAQPGSDDPLFEAISNADVANGEMLFSMMAAPPCSSCHNTTEDTLVGPGQYNVLARAIEGIENGSIEADGPYSYIYESIINPNDYAPEGFAVGLMPDLYEGVLTDEQIYDLVAYLASLSD